MNKFKITHSSGIGQDRTEEVEANHVGVVGAGDTRFLTFSWVSGDGEDLKLALPASTISRIEGA